MNTEAIQSEKTNNSPTPSPENNPCGICRANGLPVCRGHGGGSGGGGDEGSNEETEQAESAADLADFKMTPAKTLQSSFLAILEELQGELSPETDFEEDISLDLNSNGTIVIQLKPGLDKEKVESLQNSLNLIHQAFLRYQEFLTQEGKSTTGFSATLESTKLVLRFPSPKYYDEFVAHMNQQAWFLKKPEQKEINTMKPSPFSLQPSPERAEKANKDEEEMARTRFNPTPLSTQLSLKKENC